jgi:hypothetical protein
MLKYIKGNKTLLLIHRFVDEAVDVRRLIYFLPNLARYVGSLLAYRRVSSGRRHGEFVLFPKLHDRTATTKVDPHYFYQGYWAFNRIYAIKPREHCDIGSQIDFVRYLSATVKTTFVDIRPIELPLENLICVKGSILGTDYPDCSVPSISSLHVIEHIGLGRYGDPIDAHGSEKAAAEMARMLEPAGRLYISTPIGRPRTCYNAHLIRTPLQVIELFSMLELIEFSAVADTGKFCENADMAEFAKSDYACGLFVFTKRRNNTGTADMAGLANEKI